MANLNVPFNPYCATIRHPGGGVLVTQDYPPTYLRLLQGLVVTVRFHDNRNQVIHHLVQAKNSTPLILQVSISEAMRPEVLPPSS